MFEKERSRKKREKMMEEWYTKEEMEGRGEKEENTIMNG